MHRKACKSARISSIVDAQSKRRSDAMSSLQPRSAGLRAAHWLLAVLQPGRADLIDYLWRLCRCRLPAPTFVAATFPRGTAAAAVSAGGREEHHSCDLPKEWMLRWRGRLRSLNERVFAVLAAPESPQLGLYSSASAILPGSSR